MSHSMSIRKHLFGVAKFRPGSAPGGGGAGAKRAELGARSPSRPGARIGEPEPDPVIERDVARRGGEIEIGRPFVRRLMEARADLGVAGVRRTPLGQLPAGARKQERDAGTGEREMIGAIIEADDAVGI